MTLTPRNALVFSFQLDHETEFEKQAREGMNDEESQFSVQMAIEPQAFVWSDKYRPRKPRFFNRVHTVSSGVSSHAFGDDDDDDDGGHL